MVERTYFPFLYFYKLNLSIFPSVSVQNTQLKNTSASNQIQTLFEFQFEWPEDRSIPNDSFYRESGLYGKNEGNASTTNIPSEYGKMGGGLALDVDDEKESLLPSEETLKVKAQERSYKKKQIRG